MPLNSPTNTVCSRKNSHTLLRKHCAVAITALLGISLQPDEEPVEEILPEDLNPDRLLKWKK